MPPRKKPVNLDDFDIAQFRDPSYDVSTLAKSPDSTAFLFKILQQISQDIESREIRMQALEEKVETQQEEIRNLEERLLRTEQYSSRSTAIITGLKEEKDEDLVDSVAKMFLQVGGLPRPFTSSNIANIHRNRKKEGSNKPRSITMVFTRSIDKDRLFNKVVKTKLKERFGVNMHHHMCSGLIAEQKKLEDHDRVDWVSYLGHSSNFSVKLKDGTFFKRISYLADLEKRLTSSR